MASMWPNKPRGVPRVEDRRATLQLRQAAAPGETASGWPMRSRSLGQELESFFLRLDKQQFVERVAVRKRHLERPRRVSRGHCKHRNGQILQRRQHIVRIEAALARAGPMAGVKLEPHLPDGYSARE